MSTKWSSKNFEDAFDLLPRPILWGRSPDDLRGCNQCFVDLTGISKESLFSGTNSWTSAIVRRDQKKVKELLSLAASTREPAEISLGLKVGKRKSHLYTCSVAPAHQGGEYWFAALRPDRSDSVVDNLIESYADSSEGERDIAGSGAYKTIGSSSAKTTRPMDERQNISYELSTIVELSVDAIISFSLSGKIESWNDGAARLYGYSPEEVIGKSLSLLVPDDRQDEVVEILEALSSKKIIETYETIRITKSGEPVHISLVVSPLKDESGQVIAGFSVARDITRRKKAEEALLSQAHQLAKTNAELEKFAWMAAHDLKEPIRTMTTYAHLVADELEIDKDSEVYSMLEFMTQAGLRATERIQDVLAYSSLGKKDFSIEDTNLNDLVGRVVDDLKQSISEKNALVKIEKLPTMPVNRSTIMLLFQNLVANALKFCHHDPVIEISSNKSSDGYIFVVSDNGIGIDDHSGEKIFDMFSRLEPNQYPGTGIGLAICKKVAELHSGRIWFESESGKGTSFYFHLPVKLKE